MTFVQMSYLKFYSSRCLIPSNLRFLFFLKKKGGGEDLLIQILEIFIQNLGGRETSMHISGSLPYPLTYLGG